MSEDTTIRWVAVLESGEVAIEHSGAYRIIPGERKPWVRLTQFLAESNQILKSLSLDFKGRLIHLPKANFDRFGLNDKNVAPLFYSLQYQFEGELANGGLIEEKHFINLISHFKTFEVHYIQDLSNDKSNWIVVTEGYTPIAPTPSYIFK